jgi:hypothetical protein
MKRWRLLVLVIAAMIATTRSAADEAVDRTGRKYVGDLQMEDNDWRFVAAGKAVPLGELEYVRFDPRPTPIPSAPLRHVLLLDRRQRVTGTLASVDKNKVVFATSWGKTLTIERAQILGIENANDSSPIVHDDFETDAWRGDGELSMEHAFFGKSSLLFAGARQRAERVWKESLRDGDIRLFFFDNASKRRWSLDVGEDSSPGFVVDAGRYDCVNVKQQFGALKASPGWHQLAIEVRRERLRIFVDDVCLGETSTKEPVNRVRSSFQSPEGEGGKLWIDEFSVMRRNSPLAPPAPIKDQDSVWLEHGEQIFGNIVAADADKMVVDSKSGKRTFTWSSARGILFAESKKADENLGPQISFRAGPGFALDRLQAKLIRWDKDNLLIRHALLGDIAIARSRLDKVRPLAK